MTANLEPRLALAGRLVRRAADMALTAYQAHGISVANKAPGDLVTDADLAIERVIREAIGEAFPEDGLIGEEFGAEASTARFAWLIDPIDGTVNFVRRLGYFCISIALLENGRTTAAWILDPLHQELFHAGPDGVARLNGQPIRCSENSLLTETVMGLGFSTRHDKALYASVIDSLTQAGAEHRRLGAGALSLAHVAAGRLEAYGEPHMNPWDAVGGLYIAECAGAITIDYFAMGGLDTGAPVFAATPFVGDELLAILPDPFSGIPLHREMRPEAPETLQEPQSKVETIQ